VHLGFHAIGLETQVVRKKTLANRFLKDRHTVRKNRFDAQLPSCPLSWEKQYQPSHTEFRAGFEKKNRRSRRRACKDGHITDTLRVPALESMMQLENQSRSKICLHNNGLCMMGQSVWITLISSSNYWLYELASDSNWWTSWTAEHGKFHASP